jgi:lysine 2,3-aminomutase
MEPNAPSALSIPVASQVDPDQWNDWRWQASNRLTTGEDLRRIVVLSDSEEEALARSAGMFRLGITPHYASLIDPADPACPIRLQAIPRVDELAVADYERADPLDEDRHMPTPGLVHRYPDRALLLLTHECALYCRYCTRRRIVGDGEATTSAMIERAIEYLRSTPSVRDVLISGGDPLLVSDRRLDDILSRLRAIEHIDVIRIGSRLPVVMPQRITPELVAMLRRYGPVWMQTHFNHPRELAHPDARAAMERLADGGIPTGNQTVLLRGVNDSAGTMEELLRALIKVRCRPYYLYNCDLSEGLSHFRTPIAVGLAIIEQLWGSLPGYAMPTFVVDAPGAGKIPLLPENIVARGDGWITLRNFEGREVTVADPS